MAAPKKTTSAPPEDRLAQLLAVLDAHTKLLAFFFGLCFVAALLVLAVWFPQPTQFQYTVFRIVLALAAAGVAGVIPGMISLKAQPGTALLIHAGGALAVFVMVYLLAPAALKLEEKSAPPSSSQPQKEEKPAPAAQPLKISGVDAIENGVHIVNLAPPEPVHLARLSNIGDAPVHISLIGFPKQYFYTNLINEELILRGHSEKEIYIVLTCNLPTEKDHLFKIADSSGGEINIEIQLKEGWEQYLSDKIQHIRKENTQGASAAEIYKSARRMINKSVYKKLDDSYQEIFTGQLLVASKFPDAALIAYGRANFDSFDKIPYNLLPNVFEINIKGEHYLVSSSEEKLISINGVYNKDSEEITKEIAELKSKENLVDFVQSDRSFTVTYDELHGEILEIRKMIHFEKNSSVNINTLFYNKKDSVLAVTWIKNSKIRYEK